MWNMWQKNGICIEHAQSSIKYDKIIEKYFVNLFNQNITLPKFA